MTRVTLQECIEYFNSNEMHRATAVRGMEQLGEWATAAKYWAILGRQGDVDACNIIVEGIKLGDAYRAETKHLVDWVDKTVEKGIMSKEDAVKAITPQLAEFHKTIYKQQK